MIFRALTILVVAGLVFGSAGYFAYELYWKPTKLDKEEKKMVVAEPTPLPDISIPDFNKAIALKSSGKNAEAKAALSVFLQQYPDSPKLAEAKAALGQLNVQSMFSPTPSEDKIAYSVVSRDSLVKVASKGKSNSELIFRVNNLETINLRIGQQLFIPQIEPTLTVDKKAHTVTLYNKGAFFKEYHVLSMKVPGSAGAETKVLDKIAMKNNKRVAFGDKNYVDSERWILLSGGASIRAMPPAPENGGTPPSAPAGVVLDPGDLEEIFLLVSRGTPVTIH